MSRDTANKNTEELLTLEIPVELDRRSIDCLAVTLWWVKDTLNTFVTIEDTKPANEGEESVFYRVDVPEGTSPNEVFHHPFSFMPDTIEAVESHGTV